MGLLDSAFGNGFDDPKSAAIMALAGGLLQGNFGQGLLGANDAFAQHKANALKTQMAQMQMENMRSEIEQRRSAQAQAEREAQGLPGLFRSPQSMSPGAFSAPVDGVGPTMSQQDAPPSTPGGFDLQGALKLGIRDPKRLAEFAALADIGKPKVARTVEVMRNGKPTLIQLDESGQEIGAGYDQWKAPVFQGLGNRTAAIDPVSLQERGSFAQGVDPGTIYSGGITMRGQNMADARARATAELGSVPSGYRRNAAGELEFIPGGPADPNAAKRAAPTEFQGKSATYGARAQAADKIISGLDGKYSPAAVNAKLGAGSVPMIGGVLEGAGNAMLTAEGQKAEQAQRDFVNAVLRQESGAAISAGEFENARKQYFPQPFDSPAVKLQKAQNRALAIQGFLNNARPGQVNAISASGAKGGATGSFDENDPLGLRK